MSTPTSRIRAATARIREVGVDIVLGHPYRNALKIRPQLQLLVEVFDIVHETRNRTENLCVRVLLVAGRIKVRGNNIHLGIDAAPVCRKDESWQMIARIAFLEIEVG